MKTINYEISCFNDQSIYISFGQEISKQLLGIIRSFLKSLYQQAPTGFVEAVPGYNNVIVYYNPLLIHKKYRTIYVQEKFINEVTSILEQLNIRENIEPTVHHIPVCYNNKFGSDLNYVARKHNLDVEEVIHIHSEPIYTVHMIGFSPGFPFLGGMSQKIATPRKKSPVSKILAGSVGIAGKQTGIYPVETPGGWQIIGRTPLRFFNSEHNPPSLLKAGDMIQFYPITIEEFRAMEDNNND